MRQSWPEASKTRSSTARTPKGTTCSGHHNRCANPQRTHRLGRKKHLPPDISTRTSQFRRTEPLSLSRPFLSNAILLGAKPFEPLNPHRTVRSVKLSLNLSPRHQWKAITADRCRLVCARTVIRSARIRLCGSGLPTSLPSPALQVGRLVPTHHSAATVRKLSTATTDITPRAHSRSCIAWKHRPDQI